jgi:hypothetical protein
MELQNTLTTSLYSQLVEEAVGNETTAFAPGTSGAIRKEERRGRHYWYWVGREPSGAVRRVYIGPDSPETCSLVERLNTRKQDAADAVESLKKTAAAYVASGGQANEPGHFKLIAALASAGLFRKGAFLVGSHAFVSICNSLGVSCKRQFLRTTDVDFARPQGIALAIPDDRNFTVDLPGAIRRFDEKFFQVRRLDGHPPSTSFQNNKSKVRIDFLTVDRGSSAPVFFADINVAAEPLKFMDYLLGGNPVRGVVVGPYAVPVNLPDSARFAVHKLIVSQARASTDQLKSGKDVGQAGLLVNYFLQENEFALQEALREAGPIDGAVKNIRKSLVHLRAVNECGADFIAAALDDAQGKSDDQQDDAAPSFF